MPIEPRLADLDVAWATDVAVFCERSRQEIVQQISAAPEDAGQLDYVLLGEYCCDLALVRYALGAGLAEVRDRFHEAAAAFHEVLRLRGTQTVLHRAGPSPPEDSEASDATAPQPSTTPDYSLSSSRRGLLAMYLALLAGDDVLARRIAGRVLDPADADYVGSDSEVCTPNDQALAYALRDVLLGRDTGDITLPAGASGSERSQAAVLAAIEVGHAAAVSAGLGQIVRWHEAHAAFAIHLREPQWFLCVPALGLASLALHRRLPVIRPLPEGSIYFPVSLVTERST